MSSYRQSWPANSVTTAARIDMCRAGRGDGRTEIVAVELARGSYLQRI
jgi:hypothetical protein